MELRFHIPPISRRTITRSCSDGPSGTSNRQKPHLAVWLRYDSIVFPIRQNAAEPQEVRIPNYPGTDIPILHNRPAQFPLTIRSPDPDIPGSDPIGSDQASSPRRSRSPPQKYTFCLL